MGNTIDKQPGIFNLQGINKIAGLLAACPDLFLFAHHIKGSEKVFKYIKKILCKKRGVRVAHGECKKTINIGKWLHQDVIIFCF